MLPSKTTRMITCADDAVSLTLNNIALTVCEKSWRLDSFSTLVMVALRSRCGHYILHCGFFLLFYSSPNLSGWRLDVYHTSTHGVALVRI